MWFYGKGEWLVGTLLFTLIVFYVGRCLATNHDDVVIQIYMIIVGIKSKVARIWDAMWADGIANSLTVIEQLNYLVFIKRLDELQRRFVLVVESIELSKRPPPGVPRRV